MFDGFKNSIALEPERAKMISLLLLGPLSDHRATATRELENGGTGCIELVDFQLSEKPHFDVRCSRDRSAERRQLPCNALDERGFAGAVSPEDSDACARWNRE